MAGTLREINRLVARVRERSEPGMKKKTNARRETKKRFKKETRGKIEAKSKK